MVVAQQEEICAFTDDNWCNFEIDKQRTSLPVFLTTAEQFEGYPNFPQTGFDGDPYSKSMYP